MREAFAMHDMRAHPFWMSGLHVFRGVGMSLMAALVLCGPALGQQIEVSGYVTSVNGDPLEGVVVGVQRTDIRTTTGADGRYSLTAPADGVLIFSLIGYRPLALDVAGRTTLDIIMEQAIAVLGEVIVTGYTAQRRADITGAVSSVDMRSVTRQSSTSVLKRLDGRVAGVTVDASGSPGSRSTVRIRGFTSFQNNDPLYIIDGTPVEDSYLNWLNPSDIESIQVLKDASAASIYGSRASNGVVIIETVRGRAGPPRLAMDVKMGVATPVRGYDDFLILDALDYHEVVKRSYENAGLPVPENVYGDPDNPTVPAYIWPNDGVNQTTSVDESTYSFPNMLIMRGSPGTNWWDAVFGTAFVSDVNLGISGGSAAHRYHVSLNYLNQTGTAAYNRFQRGSARVNTQFDLGRVAIGENLAVALEQGYGGMGDPDTFAEDGIVGQNILMQPVVPVYDINDNFAAGKAVGLGNQSNPLKAAWADKDDVRKSLKIFGNVFAGVDLTDQLEVTTRLGFNLSEQSTILYMPISPEEQDAAFSSGISEAYGTFRDWTWSNTLQYSNTFGERHNLDLLLGHEANGNSSRRNISSINNLVTTDIDARYIGDALGNPETKNVNSSGDRSALLAFFGKLDYNFAQRYHVSLTLRRDGSSRLGANNRWGTFPAFSVGWRLSEEPFLQPNQFFTNIMLRFGWGITGNQNLPTGRTLAEFGGSSGDTFYDIGGTGNSIVAGFAQTVLGNPDLKWEENESMNLGLDLEFFGGAASLVLDAYQRETDNLFFERSMPATAGAADPPIVNIGDMKNRGIDISIGYIGTIGAGAWSLRLTGSHYRNEIVRIDGVQDFFLGPISTRYGNQVINQIGYPIGAFYGLEADGYFNDQAEIDAHATQDGAAPGRIKFVDQLTVDTDGDGVPDDVDGQITAADRIVIGSPHPDFTAGLNLEVEWGAWDFSATVFGTFGNEIWDAQKEFYAFRNFATNVRRDLLTDSWTPELLDNARYPRLDVNDRFSGRQLNSFYLEDGSYVRLRNLQMGYRIPQSWLPNMRVYVQAENLFTLTGYPGLDPALPAASVFSRNDPRNPFQGVDRHLYDVRDQYRGVDRGTYPSNRTFSVGLRATF
jgi:TonB-linked SusC/RagA family outer membrane protein